MRAAVKPGNLARSDGVGQPGGVDPRGGVAGELVTGGGRGGGGGYPVEARQTLSPLNEPSYNI